MTVRRRNRYRGVLAGAIVLGVVGAVITSDWLIALAAVPLVFVAVEEYATPPSPELAVERSLSTTRPEPGERVTVTVTVRNVGESALPDLRLVDGVPAGLTVVDGSERSATALAPGDSETVEYVVRAAKGIHEFAPPTVRVRGVIGGTTRDLQPAVTGADALAAELFLEDVPSERETATMVGVVPTDRSGSGVEFHTIREYQPGDPINRIDWRRLARSGTLSTVNYREHEGKSVTVIADCRHAASTAGGPGATLPETVRQSLFDRCRYATDRCVHALAEAGHDVGIAALGPERVPWIEPGATEVVARSRVALRSLGGRGDWGGPTLLHEDEGERGEAGREENPGSRAGERPTATPDGGDPGHGDATTERLTDRLADRLPAGGTAVLVSPLLDDVPDGVAERLAARGHPVTVVSPAVGASTDYDARIDSLARRTRIDRLHDAGIPVIDWSDEEPLPAAIARAEVHQ